VVFVCRQFEIEADGVAHCLVNIGRRKVGADVTVQTDPQPLPRIKHNGDHEFLAQPEDS